MNRALLSEIQSKSGYPCVTLLVSTTPGSRLHPDDLQAVVGLVAEADRRLRGDVPDEVRSTVLATLEQLVHRAAGEAATKAIAVCVSTDYAAVVRLGRAVRPRCVVDHSFATRDMVADAHRTALYRVITVSDRRVRLLVGDQNRLAEERSGDWPIERQDDQSLAQWSRAVSHSVRSEYAQYATPTVIAGVERSTRELLKLDRVEVIGHLPGNYDHTSWSELHRASWPIVETWLQRDRHDAQVRLERARSNRRFAGGIAEVWDLAREGRVELLVVEESFDYPARLVDGRLAPAADREAPDVVDDAVDELIETVMRAGGRAVVVPEGDLAAHDRLAAVLRY
jgi:hypothetical protein